MTGASPSRFPRVGRRRWLPAGRLARRSRGLRLGGVWLRFVTWLRVSDLDRELAAGADPMQSDELSLRVGQLRTPKTRTRFACALLQAVETADRPPTLPPSLIRRREIQANGALLLELSQRLAEGPVSIQGLALVSLLLGDGSSPLYYKHAASTLSVAAAEALVVLERDHYKYT
jgi:hypothetical protein